MWRLDLPTFKIIDRIEPFDEFEKVNEKVLQQAVDHFGPVGISIMAGDDFQHYRTVNNRWDLIYFHTIVIVCQQ